MEEKKLYSRKAIIIATFFFGPFLTGLLMRTNFINLNKKRFGTIAFVIGCLYSLLLHIVIFAISDEMFEKLPNTLIPFINAILAYYLIETYQGIDLNNCKKNNKHFISAWKVAAICTIYMIVLIGSIVIYVYI